MNTEQFNAAMLVEQKKQTQALQQIAETLHSVLPALGKIASEIDDVRRKL